MIYFLKIKLSHFFIFGLNIFIKILRNKVFKIIRIILWILTFLTIVVNAYLIFFTENWKYGEIVNNIAIVSLLFLLSYDLFKANRKNNEKKF